MEKRAPRPPRTPRLATLTLTESAVAAKTLKAVTRNTPTSQHRRHSGAAPSVSRCPVRPSPAESAGGSRGLTGPAGDHVPKQERASESWGPRSATPMRQRHAPATLRVPHATLRELSTGDGEAPASSPGAEERQHSHGPAKLHGQAPTLPGASHAESYPSRKGTMERTGEQRFTVTSHHCDHAQHPAHAV